MNPQQDIPFVISGFNLEVQWNTAGRRHLHLPLRQL
jgi:hypothetical protein